MSIVGLPEMAVRESKDRVRGALLNGRFQFPAGRVTVNLAPADLPKDGGRFDLPIAIGILGASGQVPGERLDRLELLGELAPLFDNRFVRSCDLYEAYIEGLAGEVFAATGLAAACATPAVEAMAPIRRSGNWRRRPRGWARHQPCAVSAIG